MIFDKLNEKYVEDAVKIAQAAYNMEQTQIEALHQTSYNVILTFYE